MPFLQDKWEALSKNQQKYLQIGVGMLIAILAGYFISRPRPENAGFMDLSIVAAACLALLGPNIAETQTGNKLPLLRKSMLLTLIVVIALFALNIYFGWVKM